MKTTIKCRTLSGPYNDGYWENNENYVMFCDCCGADYIETTTDKTRALSRSGITVYAGHIGTNTESLVNSINQINTKNGPLTVVCRVVRYSK